MINESFIKTYSATHIGISLEILMSKSKAHQSHSKIASTPTLWMLRRFNHPPVLPQNIQAISDITLPPPKLLVHKVLLMIAIRNRVQIFYVFQLIL